MKTRFKAIKVIIILVVSLAVIIYGGVFLGHKVIFKEPASNVPTMEAITDGVFSLGIQPDQPATIDGYINLLAGQVKRYNEVAPDLWPDNVIVNQSVIVEETKSGKFWLIEPDGFVTSLPKNEALDYGFYRNSYFGGFDFFENGVYLAVNEDHLNNYLLFEKYFHLGTYDAFITFVHEGFHAMEQTKWREMNNVPNIGRDEFLDNTSARAKRALLQRQLLQAVNGLGDIKLVSDALATYGDYKEQFPDDYSNSVFTDRIEGTAYYYELISCLYSAYPDQIKDSDDLYQALALLAAREDIYVEHGLVVEGYHIGGFSCVLLDMLRIEWKESLMNDPEMTPIEMLYRHFNEETLPVAKQLTQTEIDTIGEDIKKMARGSSPSLLFRFLYEILY